MSLLAVRALSALFEEVISAATASFEFHNAFVSSITFSKATPSHDEINTMNLLDLVHVDVKQKIFKLRLFWLEWVFIRLHRLKVSSNGRIFEKFTLLGDICFENGVSFVLINFSSVLRLF